MDTWGVSPPLRHTAINCRFCAPSRREGFAWLIVAWLGVIVLCSAWLYIAEHGINKAIESPFDALGRVVTLTTVGYRDVTCRPPRAAWPPLP